MSTDINESSELELDKLGQQLGYNAFQSFLLAGERHLVSGFTRKGTDELRFKNFYAGLGDSAKETMNEYFSSQSRLSLPQRSQLLGNLTQLNVQDSLTFKSTFGHNFLKTSVKSSFLQHFRTPMSGVHKSSRTGRKTKGGHRTLTFNLDSLKVTEAQDDWSIGYGFFKQTFNTTDETTVAVLAIDETGDVSYGTRRTGSIREGNTKKFLDPLDLVNFNIREGDSFPKRYSVTIYGIERDSGGYNNFIREAAAFAKEKIAELIVDGLEIVLPAAISNMVINLVESFMGHLIDWLQDLLHNNDDVLGSRTYVATINGYVGNWRATGTNRTDRSWRLRGEGGTWDLKGHWLLH